MVAARDRGLVFFPDDRPYPEVMVDRYQLAEALAGVLGNLGASEPAGVVLEDVPPGHRFAGAARLVAGWGLMPEGRDHFHGEMPVSREQLALTLGRLARLAEGAGGRDALLVRLRAERLPMALAVVFAREVEADPTRVDLAAGKLPEPEARLGYDEDLARTAAKYWSSDRVPASSIEWLATRHLISPAAVRRDLEARFPPAPGRGWLGLEGSRPVSAGGALVLEPLEPGPGGIRRFRRTQDGAAMVLVPGGRVEIYGQGVELSPYLIDETELTVARYARFLEPPDGPLRRAGR